jgi:DNA polymerase-3 subunit beta
MKKFTIASNALRPALKKLSLAANNSSLPALQNLYCKIDGMEAEFITSDLELTISYKCAVESAGGPFELLIPFDFISKVVSLMKDEPITIEHPSTRKATIKTENDIYELGSIEKLDSYPALPSVPKKNSFSVNGNFVPLLLRATHTVRREEQPTPALTKILLDIQTNLLVIVSTDTQCLFKYSLKIENKDPDQLLISPKIAKTLDGMENIEISWSSKMIAFKTDKVTVWAKQFEDKFPDYKRIIPSYEANLTIEKDLLSDALHKACLSSLDTKQTNIFLKKVDGKIHFETDDPDYSRKIQLNIPGQFDGTTEMITVNAAKLLSIIGQVDASDIRLHIHHPEKAVIITAEKDPEFLGLIIPFKTNTNGNK